MYYRIIYIPLIILLFIYNVNSSCDLEINFLCSDGVTCIPKTFLCNQHFDCPTRDDEDVNLCKSKTLAANLTCTANTQFKCANNAKCIPIEDVCNGFSNCPDKSDEDYQMCSTRCNGFLCTNDQCLESHDLVCNGMIDCTDGSDEKNCKPSCKLEDMQFLCRSEDECINLNKVCDNTVDCFDGSDEGYLCDAMNFHKNQSIEQNQVELVPCRRGYEFNEETKTCEDINECDSFGICSHGCVNQAGTYYCTCAKGYKLKSDKKSCEFPGINSTFIFTTKDSIKEIRFGQAEPNLIAKSKKPIGITYDGDSYYWTEVEMNREAIVKFNKETNTKEILLISGLELPEGIAIDYLTKNIYFTDSGKPHIAVCTNNGSYCTQLIKNPSISQPRAVVLVPSESLIFWTDWGNYPHIGFASMDGSSVTILINNVKWPNGLAIDMPNGRIYWIDAYTKLIETATLVGTDRRIIAKDISKHPFTLNLHGDKLYWSDIEAKTIEYCDKFTCDNHGVLVDGESGFDFYIHDEHLMPPTSHACENNPCSHICLLKNRGTYTCACPNGIELKDDQKTCQSEPKMFSVYVGVENVVFSGRFQDFGRSFYSHVKTESRIDAIEYNSLNGDLFYANNEEHRIYSFKTDGTSQVLFEDPNLHVSSMSHDYFGNNLYWSNKLNKTIEIFSLETKKYAIIHLFEDDYSPSSIAVAPSHNKIFIALASQNDSKIVHLSMDGKDLENSTPLIANLSNDTIYLAVDETNQKLYWSDSATKRIEFSSMDGTGRTLFLKTLRTPGPLTISNDYIFWTSKGFKSLDWRVKSMRESAKRLVFHLNGSFGIKIKVPPTLSLVAEKSISTESHPCNFNNGDCSDFCIPSGKQSMKCFCEDGRYFENNSDRKCV